MQQPQPQQQPGHDPFAELFGFAPAPAVGGVATQQQPQVSQFSFPGVAGSPPKATAGFVNGAQFQQVPMGGVQGIQGGAQPMQGNTQPFMMQQQQPMVQQPMFQQQQQPMYQQQQQQPVYQQQQQQAPMFQQQQQPMFQQPMAQSQTTIQQQPTTFQPTTQQQQQPQLFQQPMVQQQQQQPFQGIPMTQQPIFQQQTFQGISSVPQQPIQQQSSSYGAVPPLSTSTQQAFPFQVSAPLSPQNKQQQQQPNISGWAASPPTQSPFFPATTQQQFPSAAAAPAPISLAPQAKSLPSSGLADNGAPAAWSNFMESFDSFDPFATSTTAAAQTKALPVTVKPVVIPAKKTQETDDDFGGFFSSSPSKSQMAVSSSVKSSHDLPPLPGKANADTGDDDDDSDSEDDSKKAKSRSTKKKNDDSKPPREPPKSGKEGAKAATKGEAGAKTGKEEPAEKDDGKPFLNIPSSIFTNEDAFITYVETPLRLKKGTEKKLMMCRVEWDSAAKVYRFTHQGTWKLLLTSSKRREGIKILDPSSNIVFRHCFNQVVEPLVFSGRSVGGGSGRSSGYGHRSSATSAHSGHSEGSGGSAAHDPAIIGKLRSNSKSDLYQVFDSGMNPMHAGTDGAPRKELAAIKFDRIHRDFHNRKVTVLIPREDKIMAPSAKGGDTLFERLEKHGVSGDVDSIRLVNHVPGHSEKMPELADFDGVATEKSIKNLILHDPGESNPEPVFVFGRVSKYSFNCLFRAPLSPYVAFALAMASIDTRINPADQM